MSDCSCATNQPNCPVHGVRQITDPKVLHALPKDGFLFGRVVSVEADPNHAGHVMVKCKVLIKFGGPKYGGWSATWLTTRMPEAEQPRVGEHMRLEWRVDG